MSTQTTTTEAASGAEGNEISRFDAAYRKACASSQPDDWMHAALLGQQMRNALAATPVTGTEGLCVRNPAPDAAPSGFAEFTPITIRSGTVPPQPAGAERVRAVLAEWFSDAEGMCRAYEGDLPDKAEIYVVAAKRSRLYLGTYGELRRAALGSGEGTAGAPPAGSGSRPSDQAASHPAPAGVDPSRGWRPIATAPRDGTRIWLFWPDSHPDDRQVVGWWNDQGRDEPRWIDYCDHKEFEQPTHWRPLPAEPSALGIEARQGRDEGSVEDESPAPSGATPHPQSPSLSEVEEAPTPDPVGEAKALLKKIGPPLSPAQHARWLRSHAQKFIAGGQLQAAYLAQADRIEAALATLTASQEQDGEVRS